MDKKDAKEKSMEIAREMFAKVEGKIDRALNSDCIDLDAYQDDYVLPKIILNAVMQDLCSDTKPLLKKWQKEADNIYKFL